MKWIVITVMLACSWLDGRCQTFDEWFEQKKTQIKYLEQQIAALEAYAKVLEQGYQVAQSGTSVISAIKQGDFSMHQNYFNSLLTIRPTLQNDPRVNDIYTTAGVIGTILDQCRSMASQLPSWQASILSYCNQIAVDDNADLDWLRTLLTNGQVQGKEDERLDAINQLDTRMKERCQGVVNVRNSMGICIANQ